MDNVMLSLSRARMLQCVVYKQTNKRHLDDSFQSANARAEVTSELIAELVGTARVRRSWFTPYLVRRYLRVKWSNK